MREQFRAHPNFERTALFCARHDQNAFDPNYDTMPLEAFVPMVQRVMARPKRSILPARGSETSRRITRYGLGFRRSVGGALFRSDDGGGAPAASHTPEVKGERCQRHCELIPTVADVIMPPRIPCCPPRTGS